MGPLREGGREGGREREREGGREEREGREGGKEGGREGGDKGFYPPSTLNRTNPVLSSPNSLHSSPSQ